MNNWHKHSIQSSSWTIRFIEGWKEVNYWTLRADFCWASFALARSILVTLALDRAERRPPPHCFLISSNRSLKLVRMVSESFESVFLSSGLTVVRATAAVDFLRTTCPSLDLPPLTTQYGTPIFRHRDGRWRTSSIGSTSAAMTTRAAFFFSTRVVIWFRPELKVKC